MKLAFLFFSILSLTFFGCKSQQYTFEELPEKQIVFGYGGGITGAVHSYWLLENGQMFQVNSLTKDMSELESISVKEAKEYFLKLKELSLSEYDFDHPGNRYYFLEEVLPGQKSKVIWGSADHEVIDDYSNFYKQLKKLIEL